MTTDITALLHTDRVCCKCTFTSKKKALESISSMLASADTENNNSQGIFEALLKRERLGSTGLGAGIALPHGRIAGLKEPVAAVLALQTPLPFDALDDNPVDIIFALVVPENCDNQHLQILAGLAEILSETRVCTALRKAESASEIIALLADWRSFARSA